MGHTILDRASQVMYKILSHRWAIYAVAFGVVGGVVLIIASHAATPAGTISPDQGNVAGGAQIITDTTASGGRAVVFQTPSSTITLPNNSSWVNVTGNLAGKASECGEVTGIWPGATVTSTAMIAGVARDGLWTTNNPGTGANWTQVPGASVITNRPSFISYDPVNPSIYYESGIYSSFNDGLYKTINGGATFTPLATTGHGHDDHISVDYTDPARQTILAGGHEQARVVYKSTDGGSTWTNVGGNLPSDATGFSTQVYTINAQTYLAAVTPGYINGSSGIYRTSNGGASWMKVSSLGPDNAILVATDGTYYWRSNNGDLGKSTDQGQSWTTVGNVISFQPVQIPDGRLVTIQNGRLAVSADNGSTWTAFGPNLPYNPNAFNYSPGNNAYYISHFNCSGTVSNDAIEKLQ